ncbi:MULTISPECIES: hypothetical protein [unclassified Mucilaginibacter]|uniref:hypothetical protein n=1 Tax=unclassified Mucilaginibacter TaxID=2617802 RepID=UPI002AC9286E|nr:MULTISPECIES: hypothetical protein [unclassified Mucilaginibacter]MEB0262552.1 hypothetical protein [Mucilaginibacter sp. 10I4]MEB0278417.1 hypothetical protein [Mucilaginibacter sp. 10B2]MEB0302224.1 hypothetical protein [Mucilaginibacter sp. 5C4]WPX24062.1 hypothetical protein RHM67_02065 [Mucilaginibacter sp. 5C4]
MAQNNNQRRSLILTSASHNSATTNFIDKNAAVMQGWKKEGNIANIFLSIRFVQKDFECFSEWQKDEMGLFWDFNDRIHQSTWTQVYAQSGKTDKSGLAITPIKKSQYPHNDFVKKLSQDVDLFELRVSQKIRVHGFRDGAILYLCFLDRNHKICP